MKQFQIAIIGFLLSLMMVKGVFSFNTTNKEFQQISYMEGLPGNNVVRQIQDHFGIMWIAVEAMGVCRYDGHKFVSYKHVPDNINSISNNFVNDLIEDVDGNIWFATLDGLNVYIRNENKFISFKHDLNDSTSIHNNVCNTLYFDSQNNLWIGTDKGLSKMDYQSKKFNHFTILGENENMFQHLSVYAILEKPKGAFWLGTNQGLIQFNVESGQYKSWKNKGESIDEPIHNIINCLIADSLDNLWLGTHRGLDLFDFTQQKFKHWKFNDGDRPFLEKEGINNFLIDSDGNLWAGTYTNGILIIDPKTKHYNLVSKENVGEYPLRSNHVKYFLEDNMGSIWVGTKFEGIFKLNKSINIFDKWPENLSMLKELNSKYIYSFLEDSEGICWVGSKLEGLFSIDFANQKIENFQFNPANKNSIASNRVQSIWCDDNNQLWIGTDRSLQQFDRRTKSFQTIQNIPVSVIYTDNKSTMWVGTSEGVYVLNKGNNSLSYFSDDKDMKELFQNELLNIADIYQDSRGYVWFSTRLSGLFCYDYSCHKLKHYISSEIADNDLNSNMIRFSFEDSNGFIWIGTKTGGLNKFDHTNETFSNYTIDDGLPSNLVLSMQEDEQGNLWIGTHNGISKFDLTTQTFENYNSDYGLQSNICEPGASWRFSNSELLFGGNNGFNIFYPNDIKKIESITPVLITSVNVLDQLIIQDIDQTASLINKYDENYISFEFTLMDLNYPSRHKYQYILDGFDDHWNDNENRNYASYTALPPGNYTFRVRAANELGNWTSSAPVCHIQIKPPFYNTVLFRFTAILLVFLSAYFIYRRKMISINNTKIKLEGLIYERTQKLEKAFDEINKQKKEIELHQTILEKKVMERTHDLELAKKKAEEADHLKSSFLANMSHEIRTPLNAICGFSSLMNDDATNKEMREDYAEIIQNNSNHLLNLIEDILDISKIEAGQLQINKAVFNVNQLLTEILIIYNEDLKKKGKEDLKFVCPVIENNQLNIDLFADQLRLKQVLVNLLNNAIKFTAKGYIEFGYTLDESYVNFYVKDSGIGISNENLDLVFDRFTKVEGQNKVYGGNGIGLSISKSIVKLFGGDIFVKSELGKGTQFSFTVPFVDNNKQ